MTSVKVGNGQSPNNFLLSLALPFINKYEDYFHIASVITSKVRKQPQGWYHTPKYRGGSIMNIENSMGYKFFETKRTDKMVTLILLKISLK